MRYTDLAPKFACENRQREIEAQERVGIGRRNLVRFSNALLQGVALRRCSHP